MMHILGAKGEDCGICPASRDGSKGDLGDFGAPGKCCVFEL